MSQKHRGPYGWFSSPQTISAEERNEEHLQAEIYHDFESCTEEGTARDILLVYGWQRVDVCCRNHGFDHQSILCISVKHGYNDLVLELIQYGLDVNYEGRLNETPLCQALWPLHDKFHEKGNQWPYKILPQFKPSALAMIRLLILNGADPVPTSYKHLSLPGQIIGSHYSDPALKREFELALLNKRKFERTIFLDHMFMPSVLCDIIQQFLYWPQQLVHQ